MLFRTSRFATLVYIDGICFLSNPCLDKLHEVDFPHAVLTKLVDFCQVNRSKNEIYCMLKRCGIDSNEVKTLFYSLYQVGLIVPIESEEPWAKIKELYSNTTMAEVIRYLSSRKNICHGDYSKPTIFKEDVSLMTSYIDESLPPPVCKHYKGKPQITLSHPATKKTVGYQDTLSQLLFWSFGKLRTAKFLDIIPALLKTVPSKGARHPFEFYLIVGEHSEIAPGLYHYDVSDHALSLIDVHQDLNSNKSIVLIVTVIFERFQWRYRHSWAYKDIFYDLGHLQGTFKEVCKNLNLSVKNIPIPTLKYRWRYLEEECVVAYKVEGF
ncbi:SagB/ThcOx family dehydrogenase [Bacillus sp. IBL03825]|uniref:SagB/ThcOx family dehydrogenase n=1 Tax=Bacillus sp. IBL03825 TaxID=2953580 RepID=UPI0021583682|nr:SagB/ThcOx family dehydrogenase [Bacillus sp. IBL03825]MCR6850381.1 SagB/ThcOx family dehydrogenase [Bacillus sp. IBL03825]